MGKFKRYSPANESESSIQIKLFNDLESKGHKYILPNIFLYGWEADLVSVLSSNYVNEYEIKLSRGDFFADFKKRKHNWLSKHRVAIPNRFWFVAPEGLINRFEIPDYAGYIEINGIPKTIKQAPLLHKDKMPNKFRHIMIRSAMFKINNFKMRTDNE